MGEEWQRIGRVNTLGFVDSIRSMVLSKNNYQIPRGAYDATLRRAEALDERCKKLTLWQFTQELQNTTHAVAMSIWKQDDSVGACDRGIAEIDVAMCEAERSPK